MESVHFHIEGIVQGVGFRPHVYRLAGKLGLSGWVRNGADGVHIEISGSRENLDKFRIRLKSSPPRHAWISDWKEYPVKTVHQGPFQIVSSEVGKEKCVLLTPDYGMCQECEDELFDPANRRFRYPFITCTHCGPRYSIINSLPYDRPNTTMEPFGMCPDCLEEYETPTDRRYFSQTNSCPNCAVKMSYVEKDLTLEDQEAIIPLVAERLRSGSIVAVKGIGGYLLMCDATDPLAVSTLRARKKRPTKPFAVLYADEDMIHKDAHITAAEREGLFAVEAPIVLLRRRYEPGTGLAIAEVAPGLNHIGVMRPYAPLLALLARDTGRPLVATSGNISGSPIICDNEAALNELLGIADGVLMHDREIVVPEDDSVIRFTRHGTRIILRRSRGFAPNYLHHSLQSNEHWLGMGASMKGTFSLKHGDATYISQYLGDQDSYESQQSYRKCLDHLTGMLEFTPDSILVDMHPLYSPTTLGVELAAENRVPVRYIQHHEAHFAAVLMENGLHADRERVLGVIWDGTGLGHDHTIWGGEFILYRNGKFDRYAHFKNFRHILGDKMAREPRISALSILLGSNHEEAVREHFSEEEWSLFKGLLNKSVLETSSAGRLFDAASCLLGLGRSNSYEGEAASILEAAAGRSARLARWEEINGEHFLDPAYHLLQVILRKNLGMSTADNAFQFHYGLVRTIAWVARKAGITRVACSGGVFQNAILAELLESVPGLEIYFHHHLSPNDENISFGQLAHREITERETRGAAVRQSVSMNI